MTGRMARNKGARGENELAKLLSDELGFVVKRKLGQARDGADDIEVGPYRIECKRQETLCYHEVVPSGGSLHQARRNPYGHLPPERGAVARCIATRTLSPIAA
jgi:hypothetical protein